MKPVISIGNQDFGSIRENGYFYVDKTDFIQEWWENGDVVTLITRPRRFGKTLNMSMLEYFFSNQYAGYSRYFEGLQIWKSEKYRELQGSYPVIFISFASAKGATYQDARLGITRISKESIFSDLNNLEIVTTDSRKYETAFGFNREEVERVLMEFGCMDQLEQVRYWYDGFRFGSRTDIYNPWSITKFLDTGRFENFWANTSSNSLVGKLIQEGSPNIKVDMEDLLSGKNIETPVDEEIVSVVYYQPQSEEYVPENDPRLVSEI